MGNYCADRASVKTRKARVVCALLGFVEVAAKPKVKSSYRPLRLFERRPFNVQHSEWGRDVSWKKSLRE
jgi:hypothetical protein